MKAVFLFPGQGSQQPGMGKFLFENFAIAKHTFEEASDAVKLDMKRLCFEGADSELALTENTQPAILCVSTVTQRVIQTEFGLSVSNSAGHSIGEYAALVCADVISFADAMLAVRERGKAMQSATPVGIGGMSAVLGLSDSEVELLCQKATSESGLGEISAANFNSPGQIVISGSKKTLDWLKDNFNPSWLPSQPKKIKLIPLTVSAPFHCAMMMPAEIKMRQLLTGIPFNDAKFPIIQNFTAKPTTKSADLRENLIRQVSAPVLWTQSMLSLKEQNLGFCIEAGAGSVLKGLLKKIASDFFEVMTTQSMEDLKLIEEKRKL